MVSVCNLFLSDPIFHHFLFSPVIRCSNYCRDSGSDTWQRLYLLYFRYTFVASKAMTVILVIISFDIYSDLFFILIIHILCGDVVQTRLFYSNFTVQLAAFSMFCHSSLSNTVSLCMFCYYFLITILDKKFNEFKDITAMMSF